MCGCISRWIFSNYIVCFDEREISSRPCFGISQEGSSKESFAKGALSPEDDLLVPRC